MKKMKKYVENMKKYVKNMKKYVENMKEYEETCRYIGSGTPWDLEKNDSLVFFWV